jgi:hypothetical protein
MSNEVSKLQRFFGTTGVEACPCASHMATVRGDSRDLVDNAGAWVPSAFGQDVLLSWIVTRSEENDDKPEMA